MVMAIALKDAGEERDLYLYDTYEGMSEPTPLDRDRLATPPLSSWRRVTGKRVTSGCTPRSTSCGTIGFHRVSEAATPPVQGKVEDTIPDQAPDRIALLRLDTDWYESTQHELIHLYDRLVPSGILILDDYGYWEGARRAVDEFFARLEAPPFLCRIDRSGRLAVKP